MINIKNFDPSLLSIDKLSCTSTDDVIYHIEYITMKSLHNENTDSANYLYLIFNNLDGYTECNSTKKSNEDKYLIFASTEKNKEVLKKYTELWDEIKNKIETRSGSEPIKYRRDFIKIKFETDDDLPLAKILSIPMCIVAVGSVFQEDNKIDKKSFKNISTYYIGYITKKDKYGINSVNPLYLIALEVDGFIEEKEGSKYLNIVFTDSNSEVLKKYADIWSGIKDQVVKTNDGKPREYEKNYMKIKFNSDGDLPLNKQLKFMNLTIIIRTVFEEDGKYYQQIFLDECLN